MSIELIGWIAAVVSLCGFVLAQVMYSWDMYWVKRHHARFPMFAARDRLVRLVAEEKMREDDLAWAVLYLTTNYWLDLNTRHSVWAQIAKHVRHEVANERDPERGAKIDHVGRILQERATENPDFASVALEIDNARLRMMRGQTHWWDRAAIRLLALILMPVSLLLSLRKKKPRPSLRPADVYYVRSSDRKQPPDLEKALNGMMAWRSPHESGKHRAVAN